MKKFNFGTNFIIPDLYIVLSRATENENGEVTK
jgi:hypothetical protein